MALASAGEGRPWGDQHENIARWMECIRRACASPTSLPLSTLLFLSLSCWPEEEACFICPHHSAVMGQTGDQMGLQLCALGASELSCRSPPPSPHVLQGELQESWGPLPQAEGLAPAARCSPPGLAEAAASDLRILELQHCRLIHKTNKQTKSTKKPLWREPRVPIALDVFDMEAKEVSFGDQE